MIQRSQQQQHKAETDWYSLKAVYNDAGLYVELKIFELETQIYTKYSNHFVDQNIGGEMLKIYGNINKLYHSLFLKKNYNVGPDGTITNQQGIALALREQKVNSEYKDKEIIKKLKQQNKRQAEIIAKLSRAHRLAQSSLKEQREDQKSKKADKDKDKDKEEFAINSKVEPMKYSKTINLRVTDSLSKLNIRGKEVENVSEQAYIISPKLFMGETLEVTILKQPNSLHLGVMADIEIGQNKTLNEHSDESSRQYFISLSSQKVTTQKKVYRYFNKHKFQLYQKVLLKVTPTNVYFGVAQHSMVQFNKKNQSAFIQLDPGCRIAFRYPIAIK